MLGRTLDDSYPRPIRRDVTTVTLARLSANALYRFAGPFLAVIARGLDVSITELGVAITIAELCGLTAPLIGRFVDGVPRRWSMTIGLTGVAAGGLVVAASPHVVMFTVGLFALSLSKIVFDVGMGSWITDHVAFERRGRVVGLTETSWALGLLVGVSTMGLVTALTSWPWGYATGTLAVAVMAVVIWARIGREPVGGQPGAVRGVALVEPSGTLVPTAGVAVVDAAVRIPLAGWLGVAAVLSMSAASQSLFVTFGAWLEDEFGIEAAVLSAITFGLGSVELMASALSTTRTDRWGKERSVIAGAIVMMLAAGTFTAGDQWLVAGMVLLAVFIGSFEFAIVSIIPIGGDLVPGRPGKGLGVFLAATTIGRSITTIPATRLYESSGIAACALLATAFAACVALAMTARLRLVGAGRAGRR